MIAYVYRVIDADEVGIACAGSMEQLFWILDQFDSPHEYEFAPAQAGDAISNRFKRSDGEEIPEGFIEESEEQCSGGYLSENVRVDLDDRPWRKFKYPHTPKYATIPSHK